MKDEKAAAPKTDIEDRRERIAASLEEQFHTCRKETEEWLARDRGESLNSYGTRLEGLVKIARTTAQLAGVIARLDAAKNRGSIPQ